MSAMRMFLQMLLLMFQLVLMAKSLHGATYSIVYPKMFRIDSNENVVVNLHGYGDVGVSVYASLTDYPQRRNIFSPKKTDGRSNTPFSFEMKVSRENIAHAKTIENQKVELHVRIQFKSGGHSDINKKSIIYLTGESDYIFVQTDRPIYKPGENVDIRVIPMNSEMHPLRRMNDLVEITVQTAEGVGIWKATGRFNDADFLYEEYTIPDDPPLGTYYAVAKIKNKLHTSTGRTQFVVDKYVLPMYNVEMKLEHPTVSPGGDIIGSFKAAYSYGEPVVGSYLIAATLNVPDRPPMEIYTKPSDHTKRPGMLWQRLKGKGKFIISIKKATIVSELSWEELVDAKATVSVVVSVIGKAEGTSESVKRDGILITNTPYSIDISQTSMYFVPSMLQDINIIIRDVVTREPKPGVRVTVTVDNARVAGSPQTDGNGATAIPIETQNVDQLQVTVKTDDSQLQDEHQAEHSFTLRRFSSSSGYLKMSAPSQAQINTAVNVRFRTKNQNPNPSEIYYMVLSKGKIISTGKRTRTGNREISQEISITRKMSPSIRVVGYFMRGNDIVSDSLSIDIDDVCISEELSITLEEDVLLPGKIAKIHYQGEPGSLVGTSAVDRSAYFLNSAGRLNREKMFNKMNSFDMGCVVAGGSDALNVFEEAGLALVTSIAMTSYKSDLNCTNQFEQNNRRKRSVENFNSGQLTLLEKCEKDGRRENLADQRCEKREKEILKSDLLNEIEKGVCAEAFRKGCNHGEIIRNSSALLAMSARQIGSGIIDQASHAPNFQRTDFREGWLYLKTNLDQYGKGHHSAKPPHSITTYDIDAISVHNTEGFCVAKPAELKVFKDFFIQLYLPYSVKVMEQVQIRAAIFNYHETKDREVTLKIRGDENMCTHHSPGKWSEVATLTVAHESSATFVFTGIPLSVPDDGYSTIELEVLSQNDASAHDSIKRKLKIEPSGSEEDFSGSFPLDPKLRNIKQIKFEFPDSGVLPETRKCWIYGHMSYLGPIVEFDKIDEAPKNLGNSISLPHGCGEQNMKSVGPNVFVFNYLNYQGDPTPTTRAKVQTYIIDGYTRQQRHRNDKRWSVWSTAMPTIWLNAYVNKVFLHAREVWSNMDINPICDSLTWMMTTQQPDGKFTEAQHAKYYWINVAEGGDEALTAYVLITFAETTPPNCPDRSLKGKLSNAETKATFYLRSTVNGASIPYTAAITAYALALVDSKHPDTNTANQRLLGMRRQGEDVVFWNGPNKVNKLVPKWTYRKQSTIDIETTAYALLAQVTIAESMGSHVPPNTVDMINMIANWMVSQQNERGGFQSSQTTVIAIQSLTVYAKWIEALEPPTRNPHLDITLTAPKTIWQNGHTFSVDADNKFYRKEIEVPIEVVKGTSTISVAVTGEGRGSLSYRCVYRQTKNSEICDFNIVARTEMIGYRAEDGEGEASPGEGKNVIKLILEISKIDDGDSGMAMIDIGMISGFQPIQSSLDAIKIGEVVDGIIDEYTVGEMKLELYLNKIPAHDNPDGPLRIAIKLQQHVTVNNPSPAKILVYDYYNPEITCSQNYAVPDGSPMIRTSCSSADASNQQQCLCAEGACPTCRNRVDQLEKTCKTRWDKGECLSLWKTVCSRQYGIIAEITAIDRDSIPMFVKLTARVEETIHEIDIAQDALDKNQLTTIIVRKECFDKCKDDSLKSLTNPTYFVVGQTFFISGKAPEKIIKSNSGKSIEYYLDKTGFIERTLSLAKCRKFEKWRRPCKSSTSDRCGKMKNKLKICDYQKTLRTEVHGGCDI